MNKSIETFLNSLNEIQTNCANEVGEIVFYDTYDTSSKTSEHDLNGILNIFKKTTYTFFKKFDTLDFDNLDYQNQLRSFLNEESGFKKQKFEELIMFIIFEIDKNNEEEPIEYEQIDDISISIERKLRNKFLVDLGLYFKKYSNVNKIEDSIKDNIDKFGKCQLVKEISELKYISPIDVSNIMTYLAKLLDETNLKAKDKLNVIEYFIEIINDSILFVIENNIIKENGVDIYDYINKLHEPLKIFNSCYKIKKETYDKEDIEKIRVSLKSFYMTDEIINQITRYLNDKIGKRNNVVEIKINYNKAQNEYKEKEAEKEKLREELSNYIDLRTMKPTHTLTIDEVNRVLYILKFLKYDNDSIKEFLINSELDLSSMDTISKYKYLRSRFEYYKERYGLVQEVKDLDDYYNEFNISDNEDDKKFYKNCLKDGIEFILKNIPTTFEYELKRDAN